jgi:pilus assembly protein CpaB
VAKADVPMGDRLSSGNIEWQAWPASTATGNFIRKPDRPGAIESMAGQIARAPFVSGEPIRDAKLVDAKGSGFMAAILPSGKRAVSTLITAETGAGGFILPNDHVDVVLSHREKDTDKKSGGAEVSVSEIILRNIRVLAIDQTVEEKNGQKVVVGKTATLELSPAEVETLTQAQAQAQQGGTISLALRSITDAAKTEAAPEKARTGTGVNIVRFGVGTMTTPK